MSMFNGPRDNRETPTMKAFQGFAAALSEETRRDVKSAFVANKAAGEGYRTALNEREGEIRTALASFFPSFFERLRDADPGLPESSHLYKLIAPELATIANKIANAGTSITPQVSPITVLHQAIVRDKTLRAAFEEISKTMVFIGAIMCSSPEEMEKKYDQGRQAALLECIADAIRRDRGDLAAAFQAEIGKSNMLTYR